MSELLYGEQGYEIRRNMNSKRDELRKKRDNLAAALASVQEQLVAEESLNIPAEPTGKFVAFSKWFGREHKEYNYAAVKRTNSRGNSPLWSISGRQSLGVVTWAQLMDFVQHAEVDRQRALDSVKILKPSKHPLNQVG